MKLRMNLLAYFHLVLRSAIFWTLCGIVTFSASALSQDSNNLGHQSWSTENGLPQNSVHQIFQSNDGYIWIATEGGVARFNGIDFKVFNRDNTSAFTSDDVCCFMQDSAGALWIGTADGLLQYSAGMFRRYSATDGLPSGGIASLAAGSDGSLLVLFDGGISSFDGRRFSPLSLPSSAAPAAMATADDGSIWIASTSGVFQYLQGHIRSQSISASSPISEIEGIGFLSDHGLWLRTVSSLILLE